MKWGDVLWPSVGLLLTIWWYVCQRSIKWGLLCMLGTMLSTSDVKVHLTRSPFLDSKSSQGRQTSKSTIAMQSEKHCSRTECCYEGTEAQHLAVCSGVFGKAREKWPWWEQEMRLDGSRDWTMRTLECPRMSLVPILHVERANAILPWEWHNQVLL